VRKCPACLARLPVEGARGLGARFEERASHSEPGHVRWLNQNVGRRKVPAEAIAGRIEEIYRVGDGGLPRWIVARFIERFFGPSPHPFVLALQHPTRETLLGYVLEHQHFLRQWVRSCALIVARADRDDVIRFELENLVTEFGGAGPERPAHHELLLRMGESLGLTRAEILAAPPHPATRAALLEWQRICEEESVVEAIAAMHSLELIAHRDLVREGATLHYFDPAILEGREIPEAAKAFLREGYEADIGHASEALALVAKYARELGNAADVQSTALRSFDLFDDYLVARLARGESLAGRP
jgi:pyrroloquinoline-quinone synthase